MPKKGINFTPPKIIGRLTLRDTKPNNRGNYTYDCKCGSTAIRNVEDLRWKNNVHRCSRGCERRLNKKINKNSKYDMVEHAYQLYQKRAKFKNKEFEMTFELFTMMVFEKCYYCGAEPKPQYNNRNGIDRVDNAVGYTLDNIVTCCFPCNKLKSRYNPDILKRYAQIYRKVHTFLKKSPK